MKKFIQQIIIIASMGYSQDGIISGFVSDSSSGEALIGANVIIQETGQGMATDINGYYIIQNINSGSYTLMVSYVGFGVNRQKISLASGQSIKKNIEMVEDLVELTQIDVTAEKLQRRNNIQPSKINLSPRMMKAAPALAEPDLFRTIQALPGVLTTSEYSTGLVIRGGNTDQNLIMLDGITVYNPSHLGGVFSNFIVDGVKEAELIKGAYNAEYGGRLSAVLNVISREGNQKEFKGKANISLLSAQTTLEGPFYKGAWILSGRRTYFDLLLPSLGIDGIPPYYFYDIPPRYEANDHKKVWKDNTEAILKDIIVLYESSEIQNSQNLEKLFKSFIQTSGFGFGQVMKPMRLALCGSLTGPSLFELMELLGVEESIKRISIYISKNKNE